MTERHDDANSIEEPAARLARFFINLDPGQPPPDPAALGDPLTWPEMWRSIVALLQRGADPLEVVLPLLAADQRMALWAEDPEERRPTPLRTKSALAILQTHYSEPTWIVPEMLPAGLAFLGGRPKVGKSCLALQVAHAVATGGRIFDKPVQQGRVLFLALEDSERRLQSRMRAQGWGAHNPGQAEFMTLDPFTHQIGPLNAGGVAALSEQIRAGGYRLVVIDTLSRAIRGDQNDADIMTQALSPIQALALSAECAILLLDHHRKAAGRGDPDPVIDLGGSVSKPAVADTLWGLYKEQGKAGAALHITGRDVEDLKLRLMHDRETRCWQCDPSVSSLRLGESRQRLLDLIQSLGPATFLDIVNATGMDRGNCFRLLQGMVQDGLLKKQIRGREISYGVSDDI
jgi:hypothetical protein